jgi:hypothetical protein
MPKLELPPDTRAAPPPKVRRRFQFSLYWLMVVVTTVAVVFGLGASLGSFLSTVLYLVLLCVVPTPLVICAIFGRGYLRAFAIGAIVPWVMIFRFETERVTLVLFAASLLFSTVCGAIGVVTWRWIRRMENR